jgi:hypothetical protein
MRAGPVSFIPAQFGPTTASNRSFLQYRVLDVLAEIGAERDVVDIHEDRMLAVVALQPIADASGDRVGVGPAVGNDDLRHRSQMLMHQAPP